MLPHLTAEERPEAEAQFSDAQDLLGSMSAEEQDNLLKWGLLTAARNGIRKSYGAIAARSVRRFQS